MSALLRLVYIVTMVEYSILRQNIAEAWTPNEMFDELINANSNWVDAHFRPFHFVQNGQ